MLSYIIQWQSGMRLVDDLILNQTTAAVRGRAYTVVDDTVEEIKISVHREAYDAAR